MKTPLFLSLGLVAALACTAAGQAPAAPAAPPATFDVASIKPSAPMAGGRFMVGVKTDPGRITIQNMALDEIVQIAYHLKPYQVVGPDWMKTELFDVVGTTNAPTPRDQMAALLQPFLAQQFKLVVHNETKTMPIYALVATGSGIKAKPVDARGNFGVRMGQNGITVSGQSGIGDLADLLSRMTDRPVVDMTLLKGFYDLQLNFTPPAGPAAIKLNGGAPPSPNSDVDSAPSLFSALPDQLGLKLEARKGPLTIMVIDHAEKTPVGN